MTMTIPRAALGVFALLVTVATVDVSRAMAQDTAVTPTTCGPGVLKACGSEEFKRCDHAVSGNVSWMAQLFGLTMTSTNCTSAGYRTIYKDKPKTAETRSEGGAYPTCGGSTGGGAIGMRGSGDEEEHFELCEG